jgi:hypothetical protein
MEVFFFVLSARFGSGKKMSISSALILNFIGLHMLNLEIQAWEKMSFYREIQEFLTGQK